MDCHQLWSRKQLSRFGNAQEKKGFRHTTLVSDGDFKTFSDLKIYKEHEIEKVECLNHVAKCLGTGLRKIDLTTPVRAELWVVRLREV